jgi:hypothetical protein
VMKVRTTYAHVIALRASASWSLEQKSECIARRLRLSSSNRSALCELVSRTEEIIVLRAFCDY